MLNALHFWQIVCLVGMVSSQAVFAETDELSEEGSPLNKTLDLPSIEIISERPHSVPLSGSEVKLKDISQNNTTLMDSTKLLEDIPGVSVYGAGAISGLPAIHGLSDERLKILVDGMDMSSACPNHMNSVLSYINPVHVSNIKVFSGVTPVSVGGDSLGGSIEVESALPAFAEKDHAIVKGSVGTFYRSNGYAHGSNMRASFSTDQLSIQYAVSTLDSANYRAAKNFKDPKKWSGGLKNGLEVTDLDEVASSSISNSINQSLDVAFRHDSHLLQLAVSQQTVGFEGFPNQRMDMTDNQNTSFNVRYTGMFDWGDIQGRLFRQRVNHAMDMSYERSFSLPAMPMLSAADTMGGLLKVSLPVWNIHMLRFGGEFKNYNLNDWWPPLLTGSISMCCNSFQNIRDGQRDRVGIFAEMESAWAPHWMTLIGIRSDTVNSNAGDVEGYSTSGIYSADANRFNAQNHHRIDHNWDATGLIRYTPSPSQSYELGLARKTRSPNLYERYTWSTYAMAALMNNFAGDGNAYVGNLALKPEVAHSINVSADWHDTEQAVWGAKVNAYVTYIDRYIDAVRCNFGRCNSANLSAINSYVTLQYANQSARLHGVDFSAFRLLGQDDRWGTLGSKAVVSYVRGENTTTGYNLYHMMPLNARLSLEHQLAGWRSTVEFLLVSAKNHVSQVRNETTTQGYGLLNLRTSYGNKFMQLDLSVENALNKLYFPPLGGAYVGQGYSMSTGIIPWGVNVPGMGRSTNVAVTFFY